MEHKLSRLLNAGKKLLTINLTGILLVFGLLQVSATGLDESSPATAELTKSVQSQQIVVTGTVTDEAGVAYPGVYVTVKGTTRGTMTDADGNYSVEVAGSDAVLVFSFVGTETQEITVGDQTSINVVLVTEASQLRDIVVIGYGSQLKREVTSAISSLPTDDLGKTASTNIMEQAQGRLAGVDIIRASGIPGSDVQIRVRGNRSITANNSVLYVIDGIPTELGINDFNPNDIESMQVLKDASSVAIYGSRGANGVILITTKKGKQGDSKISYSGTYTIKKPFENIDPMNPQEFAQYVRISNGLDPDDTSQDASILSDVTNLTAGDPDWFGRVYGNGLQHQHQLSSSGGSERINYYLSGSYTDEKGIYSTGSSYSRFSFRANVEVKATQRLTVGINSMASSSTQEVMNGKIYSEAINTSPLAIPYDANGVLIPYPNPRVEQVNPLYWLDPSQYLDERKNMRIFANIFAEYKPFESLTYRLNFGPDLRSSKSGVYFGKLLGEGVNNASANNSLGSSYTLENILTFNKEFGGHAFNVVGLFSVQESNTEQASAEAQNLPIESSKFYNLGSANDILGISSGFTDWTLLSYMGRINYKFNDRYLATVSARADGSSRLAEGNKWAFFPSASVGWIISNESFYNSNYLTFLKLRGGYGQVGSTAINPYQTMGGLNNTNYAFGSGQAFGFGLSVIPNPDLRWEISKTLNIGMDFGLLNDRITGALELYDTKTEDLLLSRKLPISSGYSSILQNIGSTRNRGIELSSTAYVVRSDGDGFNWDVDLTLYTNKEEIVELTGGDQDDVGNEWFIGEPINVFYNFDQVGIWQTDEATEAAAQGQAPGDIKIADVNGRDSEGNLTKEADGVIDQDDRAVLGSTVPNWSGGITNRFSYKGFDLSVQVFARRGQMLYSSFHYMGGNSWQGRHGKINLNYWTPDNPSNEIPLPIAAKRPLYGAAVQYFDASFVKIKNISLGYTIGNEAISRLNLGLESIRVFATLDNSNALTFADFKIVDPETGSGSVGGTRPLTTSNIIFGLKVNL